MTEINPMLNTQHTIAPKSGAPIKEADVGEAVVFDFMRAADEKDFSITNFDPEKELGISMPSYDDFSAKEASDVYTKGNTMYKKYENEDDSYAIVSYLKPVFFDKLFNKDPKYYTIQEFDSSGKKTQETDKNIHGEMTSLYNENGDTEVCVSRGHDKGGEFISVADYNPETNTHHSVRLDTMSKTGKPVEHF